jgi:hypothetical protein
VIEPYETALRDLSQGLSKLGFTLVRNTEYGATFSDGTYSIEHFTERYEHPAWSAAICDPTGKKFEVGLVWQIVDPVQHAEAMAALKDIRQRFGLDQRGLVERGSGQPGLDDPKTASEMRLQGIAEYLRVKLDQELRFFATHRERVFASPPDYEAEYTLRSNALVAKFVKLAK